jgi:chaperonin GroEL (HSP60 family)
MPLIMQWAFVGTTTATVLTRAIFSEGCKSVAAGMNPMDLRRGINSAVEKVLSYLKQHAKMISTTEEIAQVCRQLRRLLSMYGLITLEASLQ